MLGEVGGQVSNLFSDFDARSYGHNRSELRNPDGECGMPDHSARLLRVSAAGILLRRCSKQTVLHDQNNKSDCDYGQH
jgi:hypothetical protein